MKYNIRNQLRDYLSFAYYFLNLSKFLFHE